MLSTAKEPNPATKNFDTNWKPSYANNLDVVRALGMQQLKL